MSENDIQHALRDIQISQAVHTTKLDALTELVRAHIKADETTFNDHEKRIRANEKSRWISTGVAGVVGSALTGLVTYLKSHGV